MSAMVIILDNKKDKPQLWKDLIQASCRIFHGLAYLPKTWAIKLSHYCSVHHDWSFSCRRRREHFQPGILYWHRNWYLQRLLLFLRRSPRLNESFFVKNQINFSKLGKVFTWRKFFMHCQIGHRSFEWTFIRIIKKIGL